ncbi:MAG: PHB depolymerase family esterase [Paracoccaceae bacterium]
MIRSVLTALGLSALAGSAMACGDAGDPCQIDSGDYLISLPENTGPDTPVLLFLHGFGGTANGTMGNQRLVGPMNERGWAVIAPDGLRRGGDGPKSWNFFPGWEGRDETAFLRAVADDAAERFDLSADHVMLSGFSAGGFMVSYLACEAPDTFAAYAPVAGGFWRPHPEGCAGPVKLLHTHGWSDPTVPLEGRKLRNGVFEQGDIWAGMEIWRTTNECWDNKPSSYSETGPFWRRQWAGCAEGSALEFALWQGGHTLPSGWTDMAIDWFEAVTASH